MTLITRLSARSNITQAQVLSLDSLKPSTPRTGTRRDRVPKNRAKLADSNWTARVEGTRDLGGKMTGMTDEQVYALAKKRVQARRDFTIHLIVYLGVNTLLICLWLFVTGRGFPWFVFPLGGWGIGLVSHYVFSRGVGRDEDGGRSTAVEKEAARIRREQ